MKAIKELVETAVKDKLNQAVAHDAFTAIVSRFQDLIFSYVFAQVREAETAKDIAQETFLIAYDKLESLRTYEAFPGWIRQIARREILKSIRTKKQREVNKEDMDVHESYFSPLPEFVEKKESVLEIRRIITNLPENLRVPIILYYINDYSQKEIAAFLGIRIDAVKKRLQRGRQLLREEIISMAKKELYHFQLSKDQTFLNKINLYITFDSAAKTGQFTLLEQMIVDGVDVNEQDARGRTLLHWAVTDHHLEAVELLVNNGADIYIKDKAGISPFKLAQNKNYKHVLALFTKKELEK